MYIFVLGYDVDFGHMEAISLMLSQKYPEKVVGYAAVALMVHPLEVRVKFPASNLGKRAIYREGNSGKASQATVDQRDQTLQISQKHFLMPLLLTSLIHSVAVFRSTVFAFFLRPHRI